MADDKFPEKTFEAGRPVDEIEPDCRASIARHLANPRATIAGTIRKVEIDGFKVSRRKVLRVYNEMREGQ